jgi:hypothetical protein
VATSAVIASAGRASCAKVGEDSASSSAQARVWRGGIRDDPVEKVVAW